MIFFFNRALKSVTLLRLLPILFVLACILAHSFSANVVSWILLVVFVTSSVVLVILSFLTNKKAVNVISPIVSSVMVFFLVVAVINFILILVSKIDKMFTLKPLYDELNAKDILFSFIVIACYFFCTLVEVFLFYRLIRYNNRVESIENTDVSDLDQSIMEEGDIELITIATQPTAEEPKIEEPTAEV